MSDSLKSRIERAQMWMRRPDHAEHFSRADLFDWVETRPTGILNDALAELARLRAQVAALEADKAALTAVLYECETVMMIVAPRSHKDEYLATLSAVRLNLAAHGTKP